MSFRRVFGLIYCFIVIPLGLAIGRKLYLNVKQEEHKEKGKVLQTLTKYYVVIQCVAWPLILILGVVYVSILIYTETQLTAENQVLEALLRILFSLNRFLYVLTLIYVGLNSLIYAICRYIFIVVIQHNDAMTIKRIRTWLLRASFIVPLLLAMHYEATIPLQNSFVERLREMIRLSSAIGQNHTQLSHYAANHQSTLLSRYVRRNITIDDYQSPIFNFFEEYVPFSIKFGIDIVVVVIKFIILSNILEGFLYVHIFIKNKQAENNGVVNVNALLSEESRIKRNRQKTINIQMTFISWLLEFVAGFVGGLQISVHMDPTIIFFIILIFVFLNFIMIPSTYLLNTQICKSIILAQGWWKSARTFLCPNRVGSPQNDVQQENRNPNVGVSRPRSRNTVKEENGNPNASSNSNLAATTKTCEKSHIKPNTKPSSSLLQEPIPSVSGSIDRSQNKVQEENVNPNASSNSDFATTMKTGGKNKIRPGTKSSRSPLQEPIPSVSGINEKHEEIGLKVLHNNYI